MLQATPLLKNATQRKKITTEIIYFAIKMGPRGLDAYANTIYFMLDL